MKMKEKVVRPGGLELPTFWFVAVRPILPNLARGVANRTDSASWGNSVQSAFSFFFRPLLRNCRHFPHLALHFRDSCPKTTLCGHPKRGIQGEQNQSLATQVEVGFLGSLGLLAGERN